MVDQHSDVCEIMITLLVLKIQDFESVFRFFFSRLQIPPIPPNLLTSIRSWQPPKYPLCKIPQVM